MKKTLRIIVTDPDNTIRSRLSAIIEKEAGLTLLDSFSISDLNQAKEIIINAGPDVLLMGINHNDSDEMRLFNLLRTELPPLPVLVLTNHTNQGARIALEALKRGAVEYFPKTTTLTGTVQPNSFFKERLISVIKAIPRLNRNILISGYGIEQTLLAKPAETELNAMSAYQHKLLVIAGCLGGIPALYILLSSLPNNLHIPVYVVQHMPEIYSKELAEDLNRILPYEVREAEEGSELKPGQVLISPGNVHATIRNNSSGYLITLKNSEKVMGFRPSIDLFLTSAASIFGDNVLTVYLSGGGRDGIEGAKVIDMAGGQIILQNRYSALLSDLPSNIQLFGIHEGSYPIERLGQEVLKRLL